MEIEKFTGTWKNEVGNLLIIKPRNRKSLSVSFISHLDNKPVKREFADNRESVDMQAELDYYETSLEVELWDKGKGFHLSLTLEILNNDELIQEFRGIKKMNFWISIIVYFTH